MQKKDKKKIKIWVVLFVIILIICLSYFLLCRADSFTKKIISSPSFNFSMLLNTDNNIKLYLISYEKESNILKVVSVNTDMVVLKKREKAQSIKDFFFRDLNKNYEHAMKECYLNIADMTENHFKSDFYINMNLKDIQKIVALKKNTKNALIKKEVQSRDLECLNELFAFENVLDDAKKNVFINTIKINKNFNKINTNISRKSFFNLLFYLKLKNPDIMFCDLPVKYTVKRIEPDKENIEEFFVNVFFNNTTEETKKTAIEVKNASKLPRMGEKTAWFLRDKGFDVIDWGNSEEIFEVTLIKDYKGQFKESLKVSKVIGCGKVIISYNNHSYYDITVFTGKDFKVYDKFDKKKGRFKVR